MFNHAQTFLIDPGIVKNSHHCLVSRIDLYFRRKPLRNPNKNRSGIRAPGVTIYLVPRVDDRPDMAWYQDKPMARVEWDDIETSTDASVATTFRFDDVPILKSGSLYAFVIAFDGDEEFVLWRSFRGDPLVDTGLPSPGSSTPYARRYFRARGTVDDFKGWRPNNKLDLKFKLFVCRFAVNGAEFDSIITADTPEIETPVGRVQNADFFAPSRRQEYMTYNVSTSTATLFHGLEVFQDRPYWPSDKNAATVAITNGSANVQIGGGYSWSNVFSGGTDPVWIAFWSEGHGGGDDRVDLRKVSSSNGNVVTLTTKMSMTNTAAKFYVTPVATHSSYRRRVKFDGDEHNMVVLVNSNSNATVRFVNNCIRSVVINAGGTGYSNDDHLRITNFENVAGELEGGYRAEANIVTNSTGGIVTLYLSNAGAGFVNANAASFAVWANSTDLSAGSGATFVINVGATIYNGLAGKGKKGSGAVLEDVVLRNIEVDTILPAKMTGPSVKHFGNLRMPYYRETTANTISGYRYFLDPDNLRDEFRISPDKFLARPPFTKRRILPSWSLEWSILYANGAPGNAAANGSPGGYDSHYRLFSNAAVITVSNIVIDDFVLPVVDTQRSTIFEKYIINNDLTDEETHQGNAWAKGIERHFRLASNAAAEDLLVYVTGYRPRNTDLDVYVKLVSPSDSEHIDDKDWTKLDHVDAGQEKYSSDINERNFVEIGYKIPQFPRTGSVLTGRVTTEENNATIVGTNTLWDNDLVAGDVVSIYPPLFPNNYMVAVVNTVTNNTEIILETEVTNVGIIGDGLRIKKVERPGQAFNYVLNDNVARYYDLNKGEQDGFDRVQVKVVMTSSEDGKVPKVEQIQVIGLSA